MNNKEKLYLVKFAFNRNQETFLGGFPKQRGPSVNAAYTQSRNDDIARSEQMANRHRQLSAQAKAPNPVQRPVNTGQQIGANAATQANKAFNIPSAPAPWHSNYVNPNTAKIQQAEGQSNQMMSNHNKQFNQFANRNSMGVTPSKPTNKSTLAFNVNGQGNFSPNR
jgi:hypothetical protein